MNRHEVRTNAGLVVPASAVERKRRVLRSEVFAKIRRLVSVTKGEAMALLVACPACKTPIDLHLDALDASRPGGRVTLTCTCTEWIVR